jgi:hypothetical protein
MGQTVKMHMMAMVPRHRHIHFHRRPPIFSLGRNRKAGKRPLASPPMWERWEVLICCIKKKKVG